MDDALKGISVGGGDGIDTGKVSDIEELSYILSGVSDPERVKNILERSESLSGIDILEADASIVDDTQERVESVREEVDQQTLLESQLEELSGIGSEVELLQQIGARISSQNSVLEDISSDLRSVLADVRGSRRLVFKDTGTETLEDAERDQDLVDEDDITTVAVRVKADHTNDGRLFVGTDAVRVGDGYPIEAGAVEIIPVDLSQQELRVVAEEDGDVYSYLALGVDL